MKKFKERKELSVEAKDNLFTIVMFLLIMALLGAMIADAKHTANRDADKVHGGCHCGEEYHFYYSDSKRGCYYYKCDNGHVIRTLEFIPT